MFCSKCNKEIVEPEKSCSTGYAKKPDGAIICYACCAVEGRAYMRNSNRITLYWVEEKHEVTNWPGTLVIKPTGWRKTRHNLARNQTHVWFTVEGQDWIGRIVGDFTQVLHCRKLGG
jgi:hypothetical protein